MNGDQVQDLLPGMPTLQGEPSFLVAAVINELSRLILVLSGHRALISEAFFMNSCDWASRVNHFHLNTTVGNCPL